MNSNADPRKASEKLNWKAFTTFDQLIDKLIAEEKFYKFLKSGIQSLLLYGK